MTTYRLDGFKYFSLKRVELNGDTMEVRDLAQLRYILMRIYRLDKIFINVYPARGKRKLGIIQSTKDGLPLWYDEKKAKFYTIKDNGRLSKEWHR